ncbi:MAG: O-antigen ligase family protein [Nitrospira sp.]
MKPALDSARWTVPGVMGAGLGAMVLALSTKALGIVIAAIAFAAMTASSVVTYYVLVATIPVQVELLGGITITKLITPLAIGMVTLNAVARRGPWPTVFQWPAGHLAWMFFGTSIVSLSLADGVNHFPGEAAKVPVYASLYFLTLTFVRTPEDFRRLLWVITLTGAAEAIITAAQVHFGFVMPGDWRHNIGLPSEGGMDGSFMSMSEGKIRAEGTTAHPILLASFFLMAIPCAAFLFFQETRFRTKIILSGILALMLYAWFYTFARSSLIGFAILTMVTLWFRSRVVRKLSLVSVLFIIAGFLSYQVISEWLQSGIQSLEGQSPFGKADLNEGSASFEFRRESIAGGWNLFLAYPLFGVGFGQAINHYMPYLPSWASHPFHPAVIHNTFLEVASELGVFALFAFLGIWGWAFMSVKRGLRFSASRPYSILMLGILLGQMGFLMITPMVRELWLTLPMAIAIGQMQGLREQMTDCVPNDRRSMVNGRANRLFRAQQIRTDPSP